MARPQPKLGAEQAEESVTLRVEKRRGPTGVQWRAITRRRHADGSVDSKESEWRPRADFFVDLALLRRQMLEFVFEGVGRPVIG